MANTSRKLVFAKDIGTHIDWTICVFCQTSTTEKLLCPALIANVLERYRGYETMSKNLSRLQNLG